MAALAESVRKSDPMFFVSDMRATVRWYESIGFLVLDRYEDGGELMFARLAFGKSEFGLTPGGQPGPRNVSLWFYTERVQDLYQLLKEWQLRVAQRALTSARDEPDVRFAEDLYVPFYGGRQFSIQDNNGLTLIFWQPEWLAPSVGARSQAFFFLVVRPCRAGAFARMRTSAPSRSASRPLSNLVASTPTPVT
jgi:catechol 2,3-dioxygenase-like lactoylglutathione lyase family enzyme